MAEPNQPASAGNQQEKEPRKNTWPKGQSGNPAGRAPGTRNKATALATAILEADVQEIARVVTKAAKGGDLQAARLVIERLIPARRERSVSVELPDIGTSEGVSKAQAAILQAAASGELLPTEAATLAGIVEQRRRAIETEELEKRIEQLEQQGAKK